MNNDLREGRLTFVSEYHVVTSYYTRRGALGIIEVQEVFMADLSHISKQIHSDQARIDEARRQADNRRMMADQKRQEGSANSPDYYEQEALRFDQQANELEDEIEQLTTEKERAEQRIADLEAQKAQISQEHNTRIAQIDKELNDLRGSSLLL